MEFWFALSREKLKLMKITLETSSKWLPLSTNSLSFISMKITYNLCVHYLAKSTLSVVVNEVNFIT